MVKLHRKTCRCWCFRRSHREKQELNDTMLYCSYSSISSESHCSYIFAKTGITGYTRVNGVGKELPREKQEPNMICASKDSSNSSNCDRLPSVTRTLLFSREDSPTRVNDRMASPQGQGAVKEVSTTWTHEPSWDKVRSTRWEGMQQAR